MSAASNSSSDSRSSLGERVTMRLISCVSLLWVFCRPALNLSKSPMESVQLTRLNGDDAHARQRIGRSVEDQDSVLSVRGPERWPG